MSLFTQICRKEYPLGFPCGFCFMSLDYPLTFMVE